MMILGLNWSVIHDSKLYCVQRISREAVTLKRGDEVVKLTLSEVNENLESGAIYAFRNQ